MRDGSQNWCKNHSALFLTLQTHALEIDHLSPKFCHFKSWEMGRFQGGAADKSSIFVPPLGSLRNGSTYRQDRGGEHSSFALAMKWSPAQTRLSHPSLCAKRGREEALRLFWLNAVCLQDESSELLGETNLCVKRSEPVFFHLRTKYFHLFTCCISAQYRHTINIFGSIPPFYFFPRVQAASRQNILK